MNETEEQQNCRYCHGDSELIMNENYGGADVYVSGNILKVSIDYISVTIDYISGASINYCPMCGRKLAEAQHDTRTD